MKICNDCKIPKSLDDFYVDKRKIDGRATWCKSCQNVRLKTSKIKKWEESTVLGHKICSRCKRDKTIAEFHYLQNDCKSCNRSRKQQPEYKEQAAQYSSTEERKKRARELYHKHKSRAKLYYENNKDKIVKRANKWAKDNKDRLNSRNRNRYLNDPCFRLKILVSGRVADWLKNLGGSKGGESITKYLPYSLQELKDHLEKQFEPWMNWENHGVYDNDNWKDGDPTTWTWNVDHIIPQSSLPYSSMNDDNFQRCWALSNLRPYSAKQNIIDGDRRMNKDWHDLDKKELDEHFKDKYGDDWLKKLSSEEKTHRDGINATLEILIRTPAIRGVNDK